MRTPDETPRVVERVELSVEPGRRDLQRVAVGDLVRRVEDRRHVARDGLAVLDRHGAAVLALEHHAKDREAASARGFDREQPAPPFLRNGPYFEGRFLSQSRFHRTKKRAEPAFTKAGGFYHREDRAC